MVCRVCGLALGMRALAGVPQVLQFVLEAVRAEAFNPATLFLFGSYTIGKERLFLEVARILKRKVRRVCMGVICALELANGSLLHTDQSPSIPADVFHSALIPAEEHLLQCRYM